MGHSIRRHNSPYPFISVIVPVRNEQLYIERTLLSLLRQDYPPDRVEILVVDGQSSDLTTNIVKEISAQYPRICLLNNPRRITASGLNIGLQLSRGDAIAIVGGHCNPPCDYLSKGVESLFSKGADCVGGVTIALGTSPISQTIALAMGHWFGVGNARFRYASHNGFVDTVAFGFYSRSAFELAGSFDEEMLYAEDDEFNYRLTRAGGKIFLNPDIKFYYYVRSSFSRLFRQYYHYGQGKVKSIMKHRSVASWRHLIPGALVLFLGLTIILTIIDARFAQLLAIILLPYLLMSFCVSAYLSLKYGATNLMLLPVAFACLHFGYGFGFWAGVVRYSLTGRRSNG